MLNRAAKAGIAVALAGLLLLVPSVSATLGKGPIQVGSSGVRADASVCDVNVTLSLAFAFAVQNNYCPTPVTQIQFTVLMTVDNVPHTFTLSPVANYTFPTTSSTTQLQSFFNVHTPLVNIVPNTASGDSNTTIIPAPGIGLYEAVCMETGHFNAGMYVFIGVGVVPPSSAVSAPGIGAPALIIVGVIAALVVIALVLGFVVGRRRGPEDEMPPERVGYPETPSTPEPERVGAAERAR